VGIHGGPRLAFFHDEPDPVAIVEEMPPRPGSSIPPSTPSLSWKNGPWWTSSIDHRTPSLSWKNRRVAGLLPSSANPVVIVEELLPVWCHPVAIVEERAFDPVVIVTK
jgi:hypothetical protein